MIKISKQQANEMELFDMEFDCITEGIVQDFKKNQGLVHCVEAYKKYCEYLPENKFRCFQITIRMGDTCTYYIGKNVFVKRLANHTSYNYCSIEYHSIPENYLLFLKLWHRDRIIDKSIETPIKQEIQSDGYKYARILRRSKEQVSNKISIGPNNIFEILNRTYEENSELFESDKEQKKKLMRDIEEFNVRKEFYKSLQSGYQDFLEEKKRFEEEKKKIYLAKIQLENMRKEIERERKQLEDDKNKAVSFDLDEFLDTKKTEFE